MLLMVFSEIRLRRVKYLPCGKCEIAPNAAVKLNIPQRAAGEFHLQSKFHARSAFHKSVRIYLVEESYNRL
jgi:hypothetical protein